MCKRKRDENVCIKAGRWEARGHDETQSGNIGWGKYTLVKIECWALYNLN